MTCGCLTGGKLLRCYRLTKPSKKALGGGERPRLEDAQRDMIRMRRVLMIDGSRRMTEIFARAFERQIEGVIAEATRRFSRKSSEIEIVLPGSEEVWAQVLEQILGPDAVVEIVRDYTPVAQSVIARAYEKTCMFAGESLAHDAAQETLRRAKEVAKLVTRINETTRERLREVIVENVRAGEPLSSIVRAIRDATPEIATSRLPTIARTEVGRLVDEGVKQAVKESSVVKTMKVVGCKAVEGNWTFAGRPTCNITGVLPSDIDKVVHHPNHTGAWVFESFHDY